jgi:hypothetical protein
MNQIKRVRESEEWIVCFHLIYETGTLNYHDDDYHDDK